MDDETYGSKETVTHLAEESCQPHAFVERQLEGLEKPTSFSFGQTILRGATSAPSPECEGVARNSMIYV